MARQLRHEDYTVGWICALPIELAAAQEMLDEEHEDLEREAHDDNLYSLGSIGGHNVVIVCLPAGRIGNNPAASVSTQARATFKGLRFGLMVGIGGGVPSASHDIRLGDVVVSQPQQAFDSTGVVQYDFGKTTPSGFMRTGSLQAPPQVLLSAVAKVRAKQLRRRGKLAEYLSRFDDIPEFLRKNAGPDVLFDAEYDHPGQSQTCDQCDTTRQEDREPRHKEEVAVHYGTIASGNQVMKDGRTRDKLSQELGGVLCFEMEAAGLMNSFACLVVRGICDYADSHKNKKWQPFAAAAAAAYAREILMTIPRTDAAPSTEEQPVSKLSDRPKQSTQEGSSPAYCIPFSRNKYFVGREQELDHMKQKLLIDQDCQMLSIVGLGGTGKTQIVLQFAYTVKKLWPEYSIFWVPALSMESFEQGYMDIAKAVGLPSGSSGADEVKKKVKQYLSEAQSGKWLLIVDNIDDPKVLYGTNESEGIGSYLPDNDEQGMIIYTTRTSEIAWSLTRTDVLELGAMSPKDATNFLEKVVMQRGPDQENATVITELLEELAYLPLAISQAAAYLNVNRVSIAEYLHLLRDTEQDTIGILSREFRDDTRYQNSSNAVASTWVISFSQIRAHDEVAADLLSFMACLEWKAIPHAILPRYKTRELVTNAIGTLYAYSFLSKRDDGEDTYDLHRLVHLATKIWLMKHGDLVATVDDTMAYVAPLIPCDHYRDRRVWRSYFPHALHLLADKNCSDHKARSDMACRVGNCLILEGRWKEALRWLEDSLQTRKSWPESDIRRLDTEYSLATAYRKCGRVKEAIELLEHVMRVQSGIDTMHPSLLSTKHELASAYKSDGQYRKAIEMLEHVVAVEDQELDESDPNRLASQLNLATTYQMDKRVEKAIPLLEHVVSIRKKTLHKEDTARMASEKALASAYIRDNQISRALELLEPLVDTMNRVIDESHPNRIFTLHTLALAYSGNNQVQKGVELMRYVVDIAEKAFGKKTVEAVESKGVLALMYKADQQANKAIEVLEEAVDIGSQAFDEDNATLLETQENLAGAYELDGQLDKAITLLEKVAFIRTRMLYEEHPQRLACIHRLASVYISSWEIREGVEIRRAIELLEHVVAVRQKVLGEDNYTLFLSQRELCLAYRYDGRIADEVTLLEHIVAVGERTLKEDSSRQLNSQYLLARAYAENSQVDQALELFQHVVAVQRKTLKEDDPGRQRSEKALAKLMEDLAIDEAL